VSTFLINHFDLFGLRQVWCAFRERECGPSRFVTPGPYRFVRHPLYVGWLTVFWATPTMTLAHFVLAAGMTIYILAAIWFEERNLAEAHPEYAEYRRRVGMLLPRISRPATTPQATTRPTAA
jgi:protein-S-isoprenylcysteine O-methyltransferase Ste14